MDYRAILIGNENGWILKLTATAVECVDVCLQSLHLSGTQESINDAISLLHQQVHVKHINLYDFFDVLCNIGYIMLYIGVLCHCMQRL